MKKVLTALFLIGFITLATGLGFCDDSGISSEKRKLIMEILKLTKVEQALQSNIDQLLNEKESAYTKLLSDELLRDTNSGSESDSKAKIGKTVSGILSKVKTKMLDKLDLGQLLVDVYLPLYDKYFTEDDLNSLLNFYKSPIGGKMLTVMPQIAGDAGRQTADYLKPRFSKAFSETLNETINEDKGKLVDELKSILESLKK
jgi:hypothetical protein